MENAEEPQETLMARRQVTILVDDLTGNELPDGTGETVSFSLDGIEYELDVDRLAADALRSALAPFVAWARRVPGPTAVRSRVVKTPAAPTAVRAWAAANGIAVSNRGRIPADVLARFEAAGN